MRTSLRLIVVLMLVLAACGGDDDASDDGDTGDDGATVETTTTTTMATTTTTSGSSGGSGDDWCEFASDNIANVSLNPVQQTTSQLQATIEQVAADIDNAADNAPSEIRSDVQLFADAYNGLLEFFAEYDFNFLSIPQEDLDDPRLNRLDDDDLEQAGDNIEAYCGFEFINPGPGNTPPPPGPGTGGGPLPGAEIPDDFPADLIPPNGTVLATVEVGGAQSITLDVESSLDDVIEFYTELLGPPTGTTPDGALWVAVFNGTSTTVAVAETGPTLVNMNVTYGP